MEVFTLPWPEQGGRRHTDRRNTDNKDRAQKRVCRILARNETGEVFCVATRHFCMGKWAAGPKLASAVVEEPLERGRVGLNSGNVGTGERCPSCVPGRRGEWKERRGSIRLKMPVGFPRGCPISGGGGRYGRGGKGTRGARARTISRAAVRGSRWDAFLRVEEKILRGRVSVKDFGGKDEDSRGVRERRGSDAG